MITDIKPCYLNDKNMGFLANLNGFIVFWNWYWNDNKQKFYYRFYIDGVCYYISPQKLKKIERELDY